MYAKIEKIDLPGDSGGLTFWRATVTFQSANCKNYITCMC